METAAEFYSRNARNDLFIECASGKNFHINDPKFDTEDIAHALSNQCRYTGHTNRFYSVAEHCVLVSRLVMQWDPRKAFEGLMHDAAEAYLSDIAAPWKVLLPDYKKLEERIETPLRKYYGIPTAMSAIVKRADWVALFLEAHHLIPSGAKEWVAPDGIKEDALSLRDDPRFAIHAWRPEEARFEFLAAFDRLYADR